MLGNILKRDAHPSNAGTPSPPLDHLRTPDSLHDLFGLIKAEMPHDNASEMFSGNAI